MIRLSAHDSVSAWYEALHNRSDRCHFCETKGFTSKSDHAFGTALRVPSCHDSRHAACDRCLSRVPRHQHRCSCLPFCSGSCEGVFDSFVSRRPRVEQTFSIPCNFCAGTIQCRRTVLRSGGSVSCTHCSRVQCTKCGQSSCICDSMTERENPGCFSRYFVGSGGLPIRKSKITSEMVEAQVRQRALDQVCEPSFAVPCGACKTMLCRTSACHEMSHCGQKTCWASGRSTLPWESCLPSWHWSEVPRWEHDMSVSTFVCREGCCYSDEEECRDPSHLRGRLDMASARRSLMLSCMMEEWNQSDLKN